LIYIIGGNGFVGSAVTRYCIKNQIPHQVITRQNYSQFVGTKCDLLINSNGNSKKFLANNNPVEDFDLSVSSVRKSLVDFLFDKYIFFSSCDVYNDCSNPMNNHEEVEIDVSLQSPYGFHKYLAELCVQHAVKDWLIIRFGGFVGEGLKKNPIYDILNGGPLWVDPQSELQYLNTDVAASLVMKLVEQGLSREIINLCGDGLVKLEEIIEELGTHVEVKTDSPKVIYNINIEKAKKYVSIPSSRDAVFEFIRSVKR